MKIIDVNILVYVVDRRTPFHPPVLAWWNAALAGKEAIGLPWVAALGFLRITTNPRLFDRPFTVKEAVAQLDDWLSRPHVQIVQESQQHWDYLREALETTGAGGNKTTDAHLAALAISRGATLVSCDQGFARFPRLSWENPAA